MLLGMDMCPAMMHPKVQLYMLEHAAMQSPATNRPLLDNLLLLARRCWVAAAGAPLLRHCCSYTAGPTKPSAMPCHGTVTSGHSVSSQLAAQELFCQPLHGLVQTLPCEAVGGRNLPGPLLHLLKVQRLSTSGNSIHSTCTYTYNSRCGRVSRANQQRGSTLLHGPSKGCITATWSNNSELQ